MALLFWVWTAACICCWNQGQVSWNATAKKIHRGSNSYHFTSPPEFAPLSLFSHWVFVFFLIAYYIMNLTLWDQISSQSSINFPKRILQYSQHICRAGINAGVCVLMQKKPGEWTAHLTQKFPNMWIMHPPCISFPHVSFTSSTHRYTYMHMLTFDIKLGLTLAVNVIFFCSVVLLHSSVSSPRGPQGKENFSLPHFKSHHTWGPGAAIVSHCKPCLLL